MTRATAPRAVDDVLQLAPYQQGESLIDGVPPRFKLSANESALGSPPSAIAAFTAAAKEMHRYPDGAQASLRQAIAEVQGLDPARVVCGNGSEETIGLVIRSFLGRGDELLMSENFFGVCALYALSVGAGIVTAPERDFTTVVDHLLERVSEKTRLVILANPNNPTGTYVSADEIRRLHAALPPNVLLLLDGAYAEYVTATDFDAGADLVDASDNVVMTRTFSKLYGLAGLRIGWCYAPASVVDVLQRLRVPFNANGPAMAAAAAAVRDIDWVERARRHNADSLARISAALTSLGLRVVPSVANFYLVIFDGIAGKTAAGAAKALMSRGIIPRPVTPGGADHDVLRITVGDDAANDAVIATLRDYVEQGN